MCIESRGGPRATLKESTSVSSPGPEGSGNLLNLGTLQLSTMYTKWFTLDYKIKIIIIIIIIINNNNNNL